MQGIIEKLNKQQRDAVLSIEGPVRVIAGAGSGKTRVITAKIAYLINFANIKPWRICALTFTNKAANEMKERIVDLIGAVGADCRISTYHALCVRILREDIDFLGYPKSFNIIDTADQDGILKNIYKELNYKYEASDLKTLKTMISNWKNEFTTPREAKADAMAGSPFVRWAEIYELYEERKQKLKILDFNDLMLFVHQLFKTQPEILHKWQNRFDYYLVDEFQDTNDLQFDILKMLCAHNKNITVVGDPDQTIYGWRGAQVKIIVNFDRFFPDCTTVILDQNYRSTQNILNIANSLIEKNGHRIKKDLFTDNQKGVLPIVHEAATASSEADWVGEQIRNLIVKEDVDYKDILILYRANYLSRELEASLADHGIPYRIFGAFKFYERKEVKDVVALLKVVGNHDELSVLRLLNNTPRIGPKAIENLQQLADQRGVSLYEFLINYADDIPNNIRLILSALIDTLIYAESQVESVTSVAMFLNELIARLKIVEQLKNNLEEERVENIKELLNAINKFDAEHLGQEGLSLINDYLELVSLQTYGDETKAEENMVSLMTVHMAKGLERKVVFVIGMNDGIFPSIQSLKNKADNLEEERRTFYVALTRAKELLYISAAGGYSFVTGSERLLSRFVNELDPSLYQKTEEPRFVQIVKPEAQSFGNWAAGNPDDFSYQKPKNSLNGWSVGDHAVHPIFGTGMVAKIIGVNLQVIFKPPFGNKVIRADSPTIKKLAN